MFDQLGAVNCGDQKFSFVSGRAFPLVDRAMKAVLEDGTIDFPQIGSRRFLIYAHHDAVGMEEIFDGRAFTEEFRIRSHAKIEIAIARIGRQRPAQFDPRSGRNSAFLNDEFWCASFGRDLARDMVDRGEVRIPALFRRRADADKNCFPAADGLTCVRRERYTARIPGGGEDPVEMRFKDGHAAGLKLRDPLAVDVRADHFMPCFCKTRPRYQADIATANHCEMQAGLSSKRLGSQTVASRSAI